jgi:hypothetical protein
MALATIEHYVRDLNKLIGRDLLQPDTLNSGSGDDTQKDRNPFENNGGRDKDRTCDPYDVNAPCSAKTVANQSR